jgi:hypothetical protein
MSTDVDIPQVIVDVEGEHLSVSVDHYPTEAAAIEFAKDYWPDKPCYVVTGVEKLAGRTLDLDNEDDAAWHDEYGANAIWEEAANGLRFWFIAVYPEAVPLERTDERA